MQPEAQPVLFPEAKYPTVPDYIQAEVFLETVGFFTPSSRRIKHQLVKEKTLAERVHPDGTTSVIMVCPRIVSTDLNDLSCKI